MSAKELRRRPAERLRLTTFATILASLLVAAAGMGQVPGDANCDAMVDVADAVPLVDALFSGSSCIGADANLDARLTAADLGAYALRLAGVTQPPTSTPSFTPTPTATASPSATSTPTLPLCPDNGGDVEIMLDNQSGNDSVSALVSGRLVESTCRGETALPEAYEVVIGAGSTVLTGLAPGIWVHTFEMQEPATGQRQHRRDLLLTNSGPNRLAFTAFASVLTVRNPVDGLGSNSLRDALLGTQSSLAPTLIQFDEVTFPPGEPTTIRLTSALPALAAQRVTLDGVDSTGSTGNRIVDAAGRNIAVLSITGSFNSIIGMRLRNAGGNNRDVLSISGSGAAGNIVEDSIIDSAASGDAIGIDEEAGSDFLQTANVVRDCDVFGASDKGIKVTTNAYARIERTWLHDNVNGGLQATLSGNVIANDNLVERSQGNATAQNGFSVNGAAPDGPGLPSQLFAQGNIARFNAGNGLSLRSYSIGFISDSYFAANQRDGIRLSTEGASPTALIEGSTVACNAINGATVESEAVGDFGGGTIGSRGFNAFTQNNLPGGFENFLNLTGSSTSAINNQWEHCGTGATCTEQTVADYDISDHGRFTMFQPAQAHRSGRAPAVTGIRPSSGQAGDLVRIFGSGFNVIDGHDATLCADLTVRNRCAPLRGNCVRLGNVAAALEAVTPTMLVIRLPFSCVEPVSLTVTTQGGGISAPVLVCTNAVP